MLSGNAYTQRKKRYTLLNLAETTELKNMYRDETIKNQDRNNYKTKKGEKTATKRKTCAQNVTS